MPPQRAQAGAAPRPHPRFSSGLPSQKVLLSHSASPPISRTYPRTEASPMDRGCHPLFPAAVPKTKPGTCPRSFRRSHWGGFWHPCPLEQSRLGSSGPHWHGQTGPTVPSRSRLDHTCPRFEGRRKCGPATCRAPQSGAHAALMQSSVVPITDHPLL